MQVKRSTSLLAAVAVGVLTASGCTDSSSDSSDETPTSASRSATTLDDGTTAPGTELELGKKATVRYTANPKHKSLIELKVKSVKRGKITDLEDFSLSGAAKKSNVYYVKASVKNVGNGDLSGQPLTLYGQVSEDLVIPPVEFGSTFKRCDYDPLPKKFKKSKQAKVCLVFLSPKGSKISEVQWRPADDTDPVSWSTR